MEKVGRYNVLERIGKGGMGVVYRALDTVLHREVALKTHTVGDDPEAQAIERFFREARVVASFRHQNIVTVYDLGHDEDKVFIAMELLRGEDLHEFIEEGRHISLEEKLRIVQCVAQGLAHAHERGIVHRDIKPRNVLITEEGEVKLLDFGLAHISYSTLTEAGQIIGTPFYMSPEQVLGEKADPRSDIFSLGSLLYELLTGEKAFHEANIERIFDAIVHREPTPVRQIDPAIPEELARIVSKMMAKNIDKRYADVEALMGDLRRFDRFLDRYKAQLREETNTTFEDLAQLIERHQEIAERHRVTVPWERVNETLARSDLTYMSLVGLHDGAALQLRRLDRLVDADHPDDDEQETLTMGRPSVGLEAVAKLEAAKQHHQTGDLAGGLRLVCDVLRLEPDNAVANELAETIRLSLVELVDALEDDEPKNIDTLVAALLAIGEPGGEKIILHGRSPHIPADIAGLSDFLLAGLPATEAASDADET